ncbi:flagellar hook-basal body complex protein FliE [Paenibacillus antarcticus]|uniref:Flagellar hook-basal body complex protein FliE n=1 Tax=Paenibacillus antarcticus TaxID=253703 RepID=A0A168MW45_9BACL|nr:flagellar hook-basal body complex protein FliE [Paenibacillus antarcticus]OAB45119.1 flagellar hook-basal body protein FliE [Paenibacillus antarcticus]
MIENTMFSTQTMKPLQLQTNKEQVTATPSDSLSNFGSFLENAIQQVADQEKNSNTMSEKLLLGQVNVDQVMIASEQALLSLQLTTQVRNKVIEAYQEIMRTQI